MSFFQELKSRRVLRVATVYLVVAWIAVQAASIALPAFDAPVWTLRFVILLFALGFPLALLLAWALDLTPEGVRVSPAKIGNKRMAGISVGLVVLAFAWYFYGQPALRKGRDAVPERSVAVMPFVNMSGNPANEYFSDGLAETTLDMLAQVPDLKVIARTSSFAFKGKPTDMREIGRQLGAAHLLEGSVQQAGDTVRITVQLIRARDGSHVWSQQFDRRTTDVFRIQDEIATSVVEALEMQLPDKTQRRLVQKRTGSVAAYDAYLKGIALLPRRDVGEMRRALGHFQEAIRIDPTYARAYVGAHDALHLLQLYGSITPAEQPLRAQYLERALALAPELGEAHIARGVDLEVSGDAEGAEAAYRRGVALAPGYATGHQWLGELLISVFGRFDEGMPEMEKALELDPLSPVIRGVYAFALGQTGRVDEAMARIDEQIAEHPELARAYDERSLLHAMQGDLVEALRDLRTQDRLAPEAYGFRSHRCHALLDLGAIPEAQACIGALAAKAPDSPQVLGAQARLALLRGAPDAAIAALSRMPAHGADGFIAAIRVRQDRNAEALELHRRLMPRLFATPPGRVYPAQAQDAIQVGIALLHSGQSARGRALIEASMAAVAKRPYTAAVAPRGWLEVLGHAQLGDTDAAFAALKRGVDAGYDLGIADLDADPLLAGLRKDARYTRILAPARARVAAQVEAARREGLL